MRVGIVTDQYSGKTGISVYAENLVKNIGKRADIKLISTKKELPVKRIFGYDLNTALSRFPLAIDARDCDLVHFTSQEQAICLNYQKLNSVATVHDLIPLEFPIMRSLPAKILYKAAMQGLKKANHIMTDSEYTKEKVIEKLGLPSKKITVVHLGVDHKKFYLKNIAKDDVVLTVSSEMPYKNIERLIKAFAIVNKKIPKTKLVKVGKANWPGAREKLIESAERHTVSVDFKESVTDLATEYNKAKVFVLPSLAEGFGLPVLEAMACGIPVVCSPFGSLQEMAGKAALYFNPYDEKDIAKKILQVLNDEGLAEELSKKSVKQAKKFSWEKTAEETAKVYRKATH